MLRVSLLTVVVPCLAWAVVLFVGSNFHLYGPGHMVTCFDQVFRRVGPALPFPLVISRLAFFPSDQLVERGVLALRPPFGDWWAWSLPQTLVSKWTVVTLFVYALILLVRLAIYALVHIAVPTFMSDHCFLAVSVGAILQAEIAVVSLVLWVRRGSGATFLLFANVVLLSLVMLETLQSIRFHAMAEVWRAFGLGCVLFSLPMAAWVETTSGCEETAPLKPVKDTEQQAMVK